MWRRKRALTGLDDDLRDHLAREIEENIARGLTPDEARRQARLTFGNVGVVEEDTRQVWTLWIERLWQDLRHATRSLRRQPTLSWTVIAGLALTIGPVTAVFSMGNWLLWRPLPGVSEAHRTGELRIGERSGDGVNPEGLSYANFLDIAARARTLAGIAGVEERTESLALPGMLPSHAGVARVTARFFDTLGVSMRSGRSFRLDEDQPPIGAPVAVLGEAIAGTAFGSPEEALGQTVRLNSQPFTVIGVAPKEFNGTSVFGRIQVWITGATGAYLSHNPTARQPTRSDGPFSTFVVRLAPSATFAAAKAEIDSILASLVAEYPKENADLKEARAYLFPQLNTPSLSRARVGTMVTVLMATGGLLLLLGCANVANLLIFRTVRRQQEVAIRKALGASWLGLIRFQLTESCLLSSAGAVVGLLLSVGLTRLIRQLMFPEGPSDSVPIDGRVLGATIGLALATGLSVGFIPALLVARERATRVGSGTARVATAAPRLRGGLAVVQLALSLSILVGALFLIATLRNLRAVDVGFEAENILALGVRVQAHGYSSSQSLAYYRSLLESLDRDPIFEEIAIAERSPFGSGSGVRVVPPGAQPGQTLRVGSNGVTGDYFQVLRLPIVRGRPFTDEESFISDSSQPPPVIVDEQLALRLFGSTDVVGRSVHTPRTAMNPARDLPIVGVAHDSRWNDLTGANEPFLYLPLGRYKPSYGTVEVIVRPRQGAGTQASQAVAAAAARLDPSVPVSFSRHLTAKIDGTVREQRTFAWMLSLLGGVALALAGLGLHGLVAQATTERRREFGIRLALGANGGDLVRLVLRHAAVVSVCGTLAGLTMVWLGTRLIEGMLFGVSSLDARVYVAAIVVLCGVVGIACLVPVLHALRLRPVEVLRAE